MFLEKIVKQHLTERISKLGTKHTCVRHKTYYRFKCDNCSSQFEREKGSIALKRISNDYKHVCGACDPKRFAQKQGVRQRKILDMNVSSDTPIDEL
jgi:predicted nucleic-acid-binding Zn-ribbon protein